MKNPDSDVHANYDPSQFLKCPRCHRTGTVSLTLHLDGDIMLECDACGANAPGHKLNESDRTYS